MMVYLHQLCLVGNFTQSTQEQITGTHHGYKGHFYFLFGKISYLYLPYWIWFYLGPAEKVRIIQFKGCYWSGKSFKKQAIVNEESKVRLSPLQNIKIKLKMIKAIEKCMTE